MAFAVTANLDTRPVKRVSRALGQVAGRRVQRRAQAGGLRAMNRTLSREISERVALPKRAIRAAVRTKNFSTKASLTVTARPVPLINYQARQGKRGVTIRVSRKGSRVRLRHGFIATMPSGHRGVFERDLARQVKRRPPKYHGLRIREMVGPQVIQIANRDEVRKAVQDSGVRTYNREVSRLTDVELRKAR